MTAGAVAFGLRFDTQFRAMTSGLPHLEIRLFRALSSTLMGMNGAFHVEEYHGGGRQVSFKGNGTVARSSARCELSDLMIIVYSRVAQAARLTYLQAKAEKATLLSVCGHRFSANLEQWYLLSRRPRLSGVRRFNPPPDLLAGALLSSVGTFAFFHKDGVGQYQIYFATASYLAPAAIYSQRYGRVRALGACRVVQARRGFRECLAACGNKAFAASLYAMQIGTPIDRKNAPARVRNWLAGNLLKRIGEASQPSDARQDLLNIIGAEQPDERASGSLGAKKVLVIESDASEGDVLWPAD